MEWYKLIDQSYETKEAAEEASEKAAKNMLERGDYLELGGGNDYYCTENCRGWDGDSSRCECYARRVEWTVYGQKSKWVFYMCVD
jgi:hypothetical protein